jgi:hypothetical protein
MNHRKSAACPSLKVYAALATRVSAVVVDGVARGNRLSYD